MATNRFYSKTKLAAVQHVLKCLGLCYITHNFFLAPTFITRLEVFWKQWINLLS